MKSNQPDLNVGRKRVDIFANSLPWISWGFSTGQDLGKYLSDLELRCGGMKHKQQVFAAVMTPITLVCQHCKYSISNHSVL
jgi:hypothetical protein